MHIEPETVLFRKKAIGQKSKEKEEKLTSVLVKNIKKENDHQQMVKEAVKDSMKNNNKQKKEDEYEYYEDKDELSDLMS